MLSFINSCTISELAARVGSATGFKGKVGCFFIALSFMTYLASSWIKKLTTLGWSPQINLRNENIIDILSKI